MKYKVVSGEIFGIVHMYIIIVWYAINWNDRNDRSVDGTKKSLKMNGGTQTHIMVGNSWWINGLVHKENTKFLSFVPFLGVNATY